MPVSTIHPTVQANKSQFFFSPETVQLVQAAVQLCWLTCVCTRLNADELVRVGGVPVLTGLLQRCMGLMPSGGAAGNSSQGASGPSGADPARQGGQLDEHAAAIATNALRCFAGLATTEIAREQLVGRRDLVRV